MTANIQEPDGQAVPLDENSPQDPSLLMWAQAKILRTEKLFRFSLVLVIALLSLTLFSFAWGFFLYFGGLLILFISAWLFALLLTPIVRLLVGMGLPKILAVIGSYLLVFALLGLFMLLVLPGLITQTQDLIGSLGIITNEIQKTVNDWLKGLGLSGISINDLTSTLQTFSTEILKNALSTITGLAGFLIQMLLVLIISFSLLVGRNYFSGGNGQPRSTIWRKVPPSWYEFYRRLLQSLESNFGVFLGGQLTVAVIYGILVGLFMSILGFPYTVTTACVCGLLMVIPFFGGPLSLLPPLLVSVGGKTERPIILLLIVLFVFQTVLLNVVLPKLVGGKAGIGPLMTLFVLLAGAQIGGIFGVLLAVPLAGVIKNMVEYLIGRIEEPENDTNLPGKESKQKAHFPPVNWHRKKQPSPVVNLEQNKTSEVEKAIEALAKATDD